MKVLMLHNRYLLPGGEDQCSIAEAALLRDHGHEVELLEEDNRRIEQLGQARTAMRTVWSRESYRRIDQLLKSRAFDILHVQNFFPLWSPSVYYAASRNRVPVVQTLHNYRLMCVNSLFFRDQHLCQECLGRFLPWPALCMPAIAIAALPAQLSPAWWGPTNWPGHGVSASRAYIAVSEFAREIYVAGGYRQKKSQLNQTLSIQPCAG